jgi:AraC-like DNA-binding protein
VFGREGERLVEQLEEAPSWEARFDLVDRTLQQRLARVMSPPAGVLCAWHRLAETHGRTTVRAIVDEVGWSQKHLVAQCHEHLGLAPKTIGRVLRFGAAVEQIKASGPAGRTTMTDVALAAGYYDHAHFVRDCREFAGVSPGTLAGELLPDGGGFLVDR